MSDDPLMAGHFFRREAGKMVAHLTRIVGIDVAEDVVQDTLVRALETWPAQGMPDNPSAWLMRVARNRALDLVRRDTQWNAIAPQLRPRDEQPDDVAFEKEIRDDQLRMMFACCHPELSLDAQVTLILKTLCGFSVSEIANALLASEDSIEKRLGRARKVLRAAGLAAIDVDARTDAVHQAIYLLFNEGYQSVREELCFEAIHLAMMLGEHPRGDTPTTHALIALMCFHAARLAGRISDEGELLQLEVQDRSKWDQSLIGSGFLALGRSASGEALSAYHVEAAIASIHCAASSYEETDWNAIVDLYESLLRLKPTPVVALNRAIAIGKAFGPERGLEALAKIPEMDRYPFHAAAMGEFHRLAGRREEANAHFAKALKLARNEAEAEFFARRMLR